METPNQDNTDDFTTVPAWIIISVCSIPLILMYEASICGMIEVRRR
jgi:hypothetical protein